MGEHVFMLQPVDMIVIAFIVKYPREIRVRTDTMDGDDTIFS